MRKQRMAIVGVAAFGAIGVCAWLYQALYGIPRKELTLRLQAAVEASGRLEAEMERDQFRVNDALKALAQRTLGRKLDAVEHRLRQDLSQIAVQSGVRVESIASGAPATEPNPAGLASLPSGLRTRLRKESDFYLIKGSFRGEGDLASTLRMLSAVQSQPWLIRVEGFDIKPANKERTLFALRIDIATPYIPDLGPEQAQISVTDAPAGSDAMWAPMAARNPFKEPVPAVEPAAPVVPNVVTEAPTATVPVVLGATYADWRLTGIIESRRGVEILLLNARTGERLSLAVGSKVMDAVVVGGTGEDAVFEINGVRYLVTNGQTLADRRPLG